MYTHVLCISSLVTEFDVHGAGLARISSQNLTILVNLPLCVRLVVVTRFSVVYLKSSEL